LRPRASRSRSAAGPPSRSVLAVPRAVSCST